MSKLALKCSHVLFSGFGTIRIAWRLVLSVALYQVPVFVCAFFA